MLSYLIVCFIYGFLIGEANVKFGSLLWIALMLMPAAISLTFVVGLNGQN